MLQRLFITLLLAGAAALPAQAGRSCETKPPTLASVTRGMSLAQRTQDALQASGADVVILARAGQDLTRYGLRYSHLGFAYKAQAADGTPAWRVVHKLNQCGTAVSAIYRQGLGEFFLDDPWRYEAAWVMPDRALQDRLLPLLRDDRRAVSLHHAPYNLVSYPWSQRYQQSNQWAIETIAAVMQPEAAPSRLAAQRWLAARGYEPSALTIGPLTRLGGRITAANVSFDDHPPDKRFADRIETVTVDSVFAWLERAGLGSRMATLTEP